MSASRDWVGMEAAISALLPGPGAISTRTQLLASLDDYSMAAIAEARGLGPLTPSADERTQALEWLLRPAFICGHQRSGTTLLQNLLDGHPQILALPNEGTYFASFPDAARPAPSSEALERFTAEWIRRFVDPNFAPHFRLGKSTAERNPSVDFARRMFGWHAALRGLVPPKLAALLALAAAFRATANPGSGPLLWVEKTPQNERYVRRFGALEQARFIQVVRDPRATFASLKEAYRSSGIASFDAAEQARAIERSLRLAVVNRRLLGARYLVVRYEDLVEHTQREVERIRLFLGIAPDAMLLRPTAGGAAVRANSSFGARDGGGVEPAQRHASLAPEDSSVLGAYAANAAREFDYSLPVPEPMARVALRARHSPRHVLRSGRAALRAVMQPFLRRHVDRSR